ncbi:MAG TPA: hypothetical protein VL024_03975, partial [Castellaniella sp.]|nr:hypothetical protein [Castellaniella sp.]
MKNRLAVIFAAIFVVLLLTVLLAFNHQKPRVLVLHSFSEDGPWERAIDTGMQRALARNRRPLSIRWRYMALSQQMSDKQWAAASQNSRNAIDAWEPDVLIAVGEEAQDYVGRYYAGLPSPQIVYVMGESPASFDYEQAANVSGVREALPLAEIVEVLHYAGPAPLRIRALGVDDPTGHAERQQVTDFDWGPHQLSGVELVPDYEAWQQAVRDAQQHADVLLVLSFAGLPRSPADAADIPPATLALWTEQNSSALPISVRVGFVASGGTLAVAPS